MYDASPALSALPSAFTSREAIEAGLTQRILERLVRRGTVQRVQRGVFRKVAEPEPSEPDWSFTLRCYLDRARAALLAHPHHALSHETAAVARGWPVLLQPGSRIHLTALHVEPRSRLAGDVVLHHSDSLINEAELVGSLLTMAPDRTVADCLRTMYPAKAVAVADAAIRAGGTILTDVEHVVHSQRGWRGRPRAIRAIPLIDPARDTWLESYSFVELSRLGVESPVPQVEVFDRLGSFVARVDGMWLEQATVAEADGRGKYLLGAAPETESRAAANVLGEKAREDALRNLGLEVVRWDTAEIRNRPEEVARRVRTARARGDLSRFSGRLRVRGAWIDLPPRPNTA